MPLAHPPLVVTASPPLRDDLLRLAAAAGIAPEVTHDVNGALRGWSSASVVLVGADVAPALADLAPERRDGVHVIAREADGPVDGALFQVALRLGAEGVVDLPGSAAWIVERLTDAGDPGATRGLVVGFLGGSGGAGATTLACAVGQAAARRGPTVVVDCDPLGPGMDRVLGLEDRDGSRWEALCQTTGRLSARALRDALPQRDGLRVLTWQAGSTATPQAFAVREALSAARRGHDVVVVDLPRTIDSLGEEILARCDAVVMVVVPTVPGVASATRLAARLADRASPGIVLRGTGVAEHDITRATRLPVVARVPQQRGLSESIDLGLGPVRSWRSPLARTCSALVDDLTDLAGRRVAA
ncbi:septum site-determining protein Ssd [Nocardioides sp.]|uniref:septum site-determining protein Ssd n=1 Tax=Nocardioides sp. TaxID=35761 RepID=UPI00260AA893|nr:septum site-determining protein Ssd [Nocardioides sp.]